MLCTSHQIITQITDSPGLYYDRLSDVKFTNDNWNVVTYLNTNNIQSHLDKVDKLFEKVNSFCKDFESSKIQFDCMNAISSLQSQHDNNIKKFASVSYLTSSRQSRSKRGLLDFGGSVLKTFFGTLDSNDGVKFSDAIDQVQSDEKALAHLMRDNIHVIKSTISTFNNSMLKFSENEKRLNKNLEIINSAFEYIINSNDKLQIKTKFNSLFQSLESIIIALSFDIEDINNAILFSKMNILHPTVLSPYQLYVELEKHINDLPKHCELPISISLQNIHEVIDISKLVCYYHNNRIITIIKIPLVLPQVYNLYHIVPMPVPYDLTKPDTYALIAPNKPYMALTTDRMLYSLLEDLDKCKFVSEKCYICELGNVYSTLANPTCETVILTEVVNKVPSSCSVKLLRGHVDSFFKLNKNRWIFVQSEPGKLHVTCSSNSLNYDYVLLGTGIMSLFKDCKAFFKTLQFSSSETFISNVTTQVANFNILEDDCCERTKLNKTLARLPLLKLNNLNNLDSLLHASIHLDTLEKELNHLESPSHFQKYAVHYMSISYSLTVLFFLYLIFRFRRWFCSSKHNSHCCIQIFNQCNKDRKNDHNNVTQTVQINSEKDYSYPRPFRRNLMLSNSSNNVVVE